MKNKIIFEKIYSSFLLIMASVVALGTFIFARPLNQEIFLMGWIGGMCAFVAIYFFFDIVFSRGEKEEKIKNENRK